MTYPVFLCIIRPSVHSLMLIDTILDSATGDGVPDLAYIKTSNTGTGRVEVHIASSSSGFETRIFEAGTTFAPEVDGTWLLAPSTSRSNALPDLIFIKTCNTPSDRVEVHIASGASNYQTRTLETPTVFSTTEVGSGAWRMYDYDGDGLLDLIYIKTVNPGSETVEVHVASGASVFSEFILQAGTVFAAERHGFWYLAPYSARGAADLVYIQNVYTGTGQAEAHVASAVSGYQARIFSGGSAFTQEDNGVWGISDYNRDGILDLTYVKYQYAGTGTVEVHAAAG